MCSFAQRDKHQLIESFVFDLTLCTRMSCCVKNQMCHFGNAHCHNDFILHLQHSEAMVLKVKKDHILSEDDFHKPKLMNAKTEIVDTLLWQSVHTECVTLMFHQMLEF